MLDRQPEIYTSTALHCTRFQKIARILDPSYPSIHLSRSTVQSMNQADQQSINNQTITINNTNNKDKEKKHTKPCNNPPSNKIKPLAFFFLQKKNKNKTLPNRCQVTPIHPGLLRIWASHATAMRQSPARFKGYISVAMSGLHGEVRVSMGFC